MQIIQFSGIMQNKATIVKKIKKIKRTKEQCFLWDILHHSAVVLGIILIQNI